jgi:hypothetical protein
MNISEIPIIEALKPHKAHFHVSYFLSLETNTPYGNLLLTYSEIVIRMECLNDLIVTLYEDFFNHDELVKQRGGWSNMDEGFKNKFYTEQVFYWLRKTADELISLICIVKYFKQNNSYPTQIKTASIGKLLDQEKKGEKLDDKFDKHLHLLSILNEISNGFKHSLVNAQTNAYRGQYEPVVFALVAFNGTTKEPIFHQRSLKAILNAYNEFLIEAKLILENDYPACSLPGKS